MWDFFNVPKIGNLYYMNTDQRQYINQSIACKAKRLFLYGKNKASRKGEIMAAKSCKKVLLIDQQSQNIGKVVPGQGSYLEKF